MVSVRTHPTTHRIADQSEFTKYLDKIRRDFSINSILDGDISKEDIVEYYLQSDWGYRFFHSTSGSIHMALNFDGEFDESGYYGQANMVQAHIEDLGATRVLELASGKGFNAEYLARKNPSVRFTGIDLNAVHVREARRKAAGTSNLDFSVGDFHSLPFPSASYDLIFVVESLCHAHDLKAALEESRRLLRPGGRLIVFDGFRKPAFNQADEDMKLAARLTERSMAVDSSRTLEEWLLVAQSACFLPVEVRDLSHAIMPNLLKFQYLARGYLKYPKLNRMFSRVLPRYLVQNAIAGVLMPFTIRAEVHGYYLVVLSAVQRQH